MRRLRAPSASCHRPFCPHTSAFPGAGAGRRHMPHGGQRSITSCLPCTAGTSPVTRKCDLLATLPLSGCLAALLPFQPVPPSAVWPHCLYSSPPFLHEPIPSRLGLHCNRSSRSPTTSMLLSPMADFQSLSNLTYHQQDRPVCPKRSERFLIWLLGLCPLPSAALVSALRHRCLPPPRAHPGLLGHPLLLCPGLQAHTALPGS